MAKVAEFLLLEGWKPHGFAAGTPHEPIPEAKSTKHLQVASRPLLTMCR